MDRQCRRLVAGLLLLLVSSSVASVAGVRTLRITEHPTDMTVAKNDPVTLKCSVDGSPAPIIEWYRDGDLIISSSSHKSSNSNHRVMLPGGDLFFFRVVHSRKESDAGVYWCVARNSNGSVRSRNATLTVAYLHPEFRTVPLATRGILGESATLECEAPRGHPEPQVRWKKNGQPLDLSGGQHRDQNRVRMDDSGNLIFTKLTSSDEGRYQCLAQNVVATRETPAVLLSIHVRPVIIRPPQDTTALLGSEVVLECGVSGDPPPHVEWRRHDGVKIPASRIRVDHIKTSLRLERLVASDAGRYVCEAENSVGSSSAFAQLTILVPPTWNTSAGITNGGHAFLPREIRSFLDQNVYLDCPVHGSPLPLVFWQRETQGRGISLSYPELLTHDTNSSDSRWKVFRNGTLAILSLRREDAGGLWCGAVSEAGGLVARTRLEVITVSSPSPPVIEVGPANQTLPLGSVASLVCSATEHSSHKLALRWWKDGTPVSFSDRMTQSGDTLRIQNLQPSDAGNYTCWIGAGEQVSAWTASISIANDQDSFDGINIHNQNDPIALPGSPSQPRLLHKSSTSLTVGWQSGPRMGASPLQGYIVEIFSSSDPSPSGNSNLNSWTWAGSSVPIKRKWRIVARGLKADQFTIKDLQPATSYSVLVRAENSHGLSLPSPTSPWFTTTLSGGPLQELEEGRQRLSSSLAWLRLDPVRPINATTVRLNWRWLDGADGTEPAEATVEGLHLWYRPLHQQEVQSEGAIEHQSFRSVKISHQTLSGSTYVLSDLIPSTRYLFFLVPFYRNVDGRPSNSQTLRTLEAAEAPEGPPRDLMIRQLNSSSCLVKWSEPQAGQRNGVITGYQIYVFMDDSNTLLANMTLPPMPTSVIIGNLVAGSSYAIRAAAWTLGGLGPASDESSFTMEVLNFQQNSRPPLDDLEVDMEDEDNNFNKRDRSSGRDEVGTRMIHETWFILAIGGVLLSTLVLLVAALVIRRRWIRNKAMSTMSSHVHKVELGSANGLGDETHSHSGRRGNNNARDILWSRGWPLGQPSNSVHHPSRNGSVLTSQKEAELEAQTSLLAQQQYSNSGAPPEYAELLNNHIDAPACTLEQSQLSLSSFLPRRNNLMMQVQLQAPPSAYATTTLVNPSMRGQQPPYSGKSSSGESSSGSYVVDHQHPSSSRNNSYHSRKNSSAVLPNNGQQQQHRIPNLVDLLPPPPRHPPPPSPAPNIERTSHKDKSLPIAGKPQLKFGSGNSSPALSKRSVPSSTTSSFKPPSIFYQASLQGSLTEQQMCNTEIGESVGQEEESAQFVRSSLVNSKSAIKSPVRRIVNSNDCQSSRPFPVSNYTAPINYHCNPLDNITTAWDDDGEDDYSHSISAGADDSELSDGTEDMRSSVYDNNPVAFRPTQREVNASPKDRPHVTMK